MLQILSSMTSSPWLLALETHLRTDLVCTRVPSNYDHVSITFKRDEYLEDFYDLRVGLGERFSDFESHGVSFQFSHSNSLIPSWHSDLLAVALHYRLYDFAAERIKETDVASKEGRPYLQYLLWNTGMLPDGLSVMKLLLSKGCSPNEQFGLRTTWQYFLSRLLKLGLHGSSDEQALLFVEFGADPNQQVIVDGYQCSPLHVILHIRWDARSNVSEEQLWMLQSFPKVESVIQTLVRNGADIYAKDSRGGSPLELAAKTWPEIVRLLTTKVRAASRPVSFTKLPERPLPRMRDSRTESMSLEIAIHSSTRKHRIRKSRKAKGKRISTPNLSTTKQKR
jgi:hypothetical protein